MSLSLSRLDFDLASSKRNGRALLLKKVSHSKTSKTIFHAVQSISRINMHLYISCRIKTQNIWLFKKLFKRVPRICFHINGVCWPLSLSNVSWMTLTAYRVAISEPAPRKKICMGLSFRFEVLHYILVVVNKFCECNSKGEKGLPSYLWDQ